MPSRLCMEFDYKLLDKLLDAIQALYGIGLTIGCRLGFIYISYILLL